MPLFYSKEKVQEAQRQRRYLAEILYSVIELLESKGATFIQNEIDSGVVEFVYNGHTIRFNEFPEYFRGFKIDSKVVWVDKIVELLMVPRIKKQ